MPYIDRSHTTYGATMPDWLIAPDNVSSATASGLGDVKLIASYQVTLPTNNLGVQLGVKLPTGRYGGQNVNTGATVGRNPVLFRSGPNAAARQPLDGSLQRVPPALTSFSVPTTTSSSARISMPSSTASSRLS